MQTAIPNCTATPRQSNIEDILDYLNIGNGITCLDALRMFHTTELRHYISELRKMGISIRGEWENDGNGKRYVRYYLDKKATI